MSKPSKKARESALMISPPTRRAVSIATSVFPVAVAPEDEQHPRRRPCGHDHSSARSSSRNFFSSAPSARVFQLLDRLDLDLPERARA